MNKKVLFALLLVVGALSIGVWALTSPGLTIENRSGKLIREFRLEADELIVTAKDIEADSIVKKRSKPSYTKSVSYFVRFEGDDVVTGTSGTTNIPHRGAVIVTVEKDGTIRTTLK